MVAIMKTFLAAAAYYGSHGPPFSTQNIIGSIGNNAMSDHSSYASSGLPTACSLQGFVPQFPPDQHDLVVPKQTPRFIALAFGVQNYTCSDKNIFTPTGAVAELIDVSCIAKEPVFPTIQNDVFTVWNNLVSYPIQLIIDFLHHVDAPEVLSQHYFTKNPVTGQGASPKWDFTSSGAFKGKPDAYIVAKPNGTIPAPTNPALDVAWLHLVNMQGKIADEVFRFDTVGGQPPKQCVCGKDKDISVKYVSKYIFYGGSDMSPKN